MKNTFIYLILIFTVYNFTFCKKTEEKSCFKSFGNPTSKIQYFTHIDSLIIYDDIEINFFQDNMNFVEINDFKNTIHFIDLNFSENSLTIKNKNKCRFLRKKNIHPILNLHFDTIYKIKLFGSGNILNSGEWNQDSINIFSQESSSTIDLNINCKNFYMYNNTGEMNGYIKGTANHTYCYQGEYNNINLTNLITPNLHFASATSGDVKVFSNHFLHVELWDTGNIIYFGNPDSIYISEHHYTGNLIKGD